MAESDACAAQPVQNVENAFEQVKGRADQTHWDQFLQTMMKEVQTMNPDQRQEFFAQLGSCNASRRAANPSIPKLEIGPAQPTTSPVRPA
jgi:hypothetical protein